MTSTAVFATLGTLLTTLCATLLYVGSAHQALLAKPLPARMTTISAIVALVAGTVFWIIAWGGLVGGLMTLAVWMTVSAALPFLAARKAG